MAAARLAQAKEAQRAKNAGSIHSFCAAHGVAVMCKMTYQVKFLAI